MASKLDLLLEAEKRGILDDNNKALLDEARHRNLIPNDTSSTTPKSDTSLDYSKPSVDQKIAPEASQVDPRTGMVTPRTQEEQQNSDNRSKLFVEGVKDIGLGPAELMNKVAPNMTGTVGEGIARASDLFRNDQNKLFNDNSLNQKDTITNSTNNVAQDLATRNQELNTIEDKTPGGTAARIVPQLAATYEAGGAPLWLNGAKSAVSKVATSAESIGTKLVNFGKDVAKTGAQSTVAGAELGAVQPTSTTDVNTNLQNAKRSGEISGVLSSGIRGVAEPVVSGLTDLGRKIIGSTKEATERLGKKLTTEATDINAAQADRLRQVQETKTINQDLANKGIQGEYKSSDANNTDIGTAAVYKKYEGQDNAELQRHQDTQDLIGKIVRVGSNPNADVTAVGKKAQQTVTDKESTINADEVLNNIDIKTIPGAQSSSSAQAGTQTKLNEIKNVTRLLYNKADELAKNESVDLTVAAQDLTKLRNEGLATKQAIDSSPNIRSLFEIDENGIVSPKAGITYKDLHDFEKNISTQDIANASGATQESLINARNILTGARSTNAKAIATKNPTFKAANDQADNYFKNYVLPYTRVNTIGGGNEVDKAIVAYTDAVQAKKAINPDEFLQKYIIKKGTQGAKTIDEIRALDPTLSVDIENYLVDLAKKSSQDANGVFSTTKLNTFINDYKPTLDKFPSLQGTIQDINSNISNATTAEASRTELGKSFVAKVAKNFNEDPSTFVRKALKNPIYAQKLADTAGNDPAALAGLQQAVQQEIESRSLKVIGKTSQNPGRTAPVGMFLESLANPSSQEKKSLEILWGKAKTDDILTATQIIQRESIGGSRSVTKAADSLAETATEHAAKGIAIQGGLLHGGAVYNAVGQFFSSLTDRELIKVASKARADPQFAHDVVELYRNQTPTISDTYKKLSDIITNAVPGIIAPKYKDRSPGSLQDLKPPVKPSPTRIELNTPRGKPQSKLEDLNVKGNSAIATTLGGSGTDSIKKKFGDEVNTTTADSIARKSNISPEYIHTVLNIESNYGKNLTPIGVKNTTVSGVAHFTDGTWKAMVDKYGAKEGITLAQKNDPKAQIVMLGHLTQENKTAEQEILGREPTNPELYMAHMLGKSGAKKVLSNIRQPVSATTLFSQDAVRNNRGIFFTDQGKARTPKGVYKEIERRYNSKKISSAPPNTNIG